MMLELVFTQIWRRPQAGGRTQILCQMNYWQAMLTLSFLVRLSAVLSNRAMADKMKAKLGYKQELRRNFTMIEVFGIAFNIIGLLPSSASTLSFSIPAGPAGMVW
jgi:hypothetical protein